MDRILIIKNFLENNRLASVATISVGKKEPQISVVYYVYENGALYFATDKNSQKAKNILKNKSLALAIVQENQLELLQIQGRGEIVVDKEERVVMIQKIHNRLSKDDIHEPWPLMKLHPHKLEVFEVTIESFTYSNFAKEQFLEGNAHDLHREYRRPQGSSRESGYSHRPRFFPHLRR